MASGSFTPFGPSPAGEPPSGPTSLDAQRGILRALHGPLQVAEVAIELTTLPSHPRQWPRRYEGELRKAALSHWLGLEGDVGVVVRERPNPDGTPGRTLIYHRHAAATDRMLRILYDCWWDEPSGVHVGERGINPIHLAGSLLEFYNGVFLEDHRTGQWRLFCSQPLARPVADEIVLEHPGRDPEIFSKAVYFKPFGSTLKGSPGRPMALTLPAQVPSPLWPSA